MATVDGLSLFHSLCAFPQRQLRLGPTEAAVVQALLTQRERHRLSGGQAPLCLSVDELAACTGKPPGTVRRTISRVNVKLLTQSITIVSLHSVLGPLRYALYKLAEVSPDF